MMDINSYNENGRTPLMEAANLGDIEEVRRLLALGADPYLRDASFGTSTAKMFAGRKAHDGNVYYEIEQLLGDITGEDVVYRSLYQEEIEVDRKYFGKNTESGWDFDVAQVLYVLGFISLFLAPFTGITVVTAAAFFVIGYILR